MTNVTGTILTGPGTPAPQVTGKVRVTHTTEDSVGTLAASWQPIVIALDGTWTVDAVPIAYEGIGYLFEFFDGNGYLIHEKAIAVPDATPIDFDTALPMYPSPTVPGYIMIVDLVAEAEAAAAQATTSASTAQAAAGTATTAANDADADASTASTAATTATGAATTATTAADTAAGILTDVQTIFASLDSEVAGIMLDTASETQDAVLELLGTITNLDGGNATTIYTATINFDGGSAI